MYMKRGIRGARKVGISVFGTRVCSHPSSSSGAPHSRMFRNSTPIARTLTRSVANGYSVTGLKCFSAGAPQVDLSKFIPNKTDSLVRDRERATRMPVEIREQIVELAKRGSGKNIAALAKQFKVTPDRIRAIIKLSLLPSPFDENGAPREDCLPERLGKARARKAAEEGKPVEEIPLELPETIVQQGAMDKILDSYFGQKIPFDEHRKALRGASAGKAAEASIYDLAVMSDEDLLQAINSGAVDAAKAMKARRQAREKKKAAEAALHETEFTKAQDSLLLNALKDGSVVAAADQNPITAAAKARISEDDAVQWIIVDTSSREKNDDNLPNMFIHTSFDKELEPVSALEKEFYGKKLGMEALPHSEQAAKKAKKAQQS